MAVYVEGKTEESRKPQEQNDSATDRNNQGDGEELGLFNGAETTGKTKTQIKFSMKIQE